MNPVAKMNYLMAKDTYVSGEKQISSADQKAIETLADHATINALDKDGDGKVSFDEILEWKYYTNKDNPDWAQEVREACKHLAKNPSLFKYADGGGTGDKYDGGITTDEALGVLNKLNPENPYN